MNPPAICPQAAPAGPVKLCYNFSRDCTVNLFFKA